jgi:ABC-type Na+ efflux pump permease subunit
MRQVIGDILPVALGVAISPVPIIATVMVPVLAYLVARSRMQAPLDRLRVWLTASNATVMSVRLLVSGVAIFGKGLAGPQECR